MWAHHDILQKKIQGLLNPIDQQLEDITDKMRAMTTVANEPSVTDRDRNSPKVGIGVVRPGNGGLGTV